MAYALFKNERRASEWYTTRDQAIFEAYSKGYVWRSTFRWDMPRLQENVKIINSGRKEISGK